MGNKDVKKELTNLLNDKKFLNVVYIALVIAFVLIAISFITTSRKKETTNTSSLNTLESENFTLKEEVTNYEEKEQKELQLLLSKMENVGEVDVKIYFKSGEIKVPATEGTIQESITQESDSSGGIRTNNQLTDGSTIVMAGDNGNSEPYILQVNKPEITGVIVIAEGANSSKVKYDIQVAISSLYGISIDKVNVYPMKN